MPTFKAAPMPDFSRTFCTATKKEGSVPALTEPEPFHLSTDERHRLHEDQLGRRVEAQVLHCYMNYLSVDEN